MHLAEKILLPQPLTFGGDYPLTYLTGRQYPEKAVSRKLPLGWSTAKNQLNASSRTKQRVIECLGPVVGGGSKPEKLSDAKP
jgi:hypothetical protein